jgi:2,3-bisphosphoglycerate-dependent phosphoglycerate mutase
VVASSEQVWPSRLSLIRHGESAGNVARDAAEAAGAALIEITGRDVDVPLSELGERQSRALGRWYRARPAAERPSVLLTSPYVRARQTATLLAEAAGLSDLVHEVDERLREKEFGILNRLTRAGIRQKYPEQWEMRVQMGKFYYRPPGGESWCDVILRLRSVLNHVQIQYRNERVLVVGHQVIVLCFRYLLEELSEERILEIDRQGEVANCSITDYVFTREDNGQQCMALNVYNFVAPLEEQATPVTEEPDAPTALR